MQASRKNRARSMIVRIVAMALRATSCVFLVTGCNSPMVSQQSVSHRLEEPATRLLLGVHRQTNLLLGEVALNTDLSSIRLRINDPLILKRYFPGKRGLVHGSLGTQARMRDVFERAFASRLVVVHDHSTDPDQAPTHALDATVFEADSGVALKLNLTSLRSNLPVGSSRAVIAGADLSLVTRPLEDEQLDAESIQPPVAKTKTGTKATVEVSPQPPTQSTPSPEPKRALAPGSVPDWVYEVLTRYSQPAQSTPR